MCVIGVDWQVVLFVVICCFYHCCYLLLPLLLSHTLYQDRYCNDRPGTVCRMYLRSCNVEDVTTLTR
jgi:hypothetical protein